MAPPVSYATDILPLFTAIDIAHMKRLGVMLDDFAYMSVPANAQNVYDHLTAANGASLMPPGNAWSATNIALFKSWMDGGLLP